MQQATSLYDRHFSTVERLCIGWLRVLDRHLWQLPVAVGIVLFIGTVLLDKRYPDALDFWWVPAVALIVWSVWRINERFLFGVVDRSFRRWDSIYFERAGISPALFALTYELDWLVGSNEFESLGLREQRKAVATAYRERGLASLLPYSANISDEQFIVDFEAELDRDEKGFWLPIDPREVLGHDDATIRRLLAHQLD